MGEEGVTLIAECSTNHGGNLARAQQFAETFAKAGATIVKFQLTRIRHLRFGDPQYAWFAQCELSNAEVRDISQTVRENGAIPMWTVYHTDDIQELVDAGLTYLKIGSGEAHRPDIAMHLHALPDTFKHIYVSTGIFPPHPIYKLHPEVDFLTCISRYPTPHGLAVSLLATTGYHGWSDHSVGFNECRAAVIAGATIIEKHVMMPTQARAHQPWETSASEFAAFRQWTQEDPEARFVDRWTR